MTATDSDAPSPDDSLPAQSVYQLSAFQRDLLIAIKTLEDEGTPYGLEIKRHLENLYEGDVNHGRLYPNLNDLVTKGYVKKGRIDDRTNSYTLTDKGVNALRSRKKEIDTAL